MKLNNELTKKINELKKDESLYNQFVSYMDKNGVPKLQYSQLNKLSKKVNDLIIAYFNESDKIKKEESEMNTQNNSETALTVLAPTGTDGVKETEIVINKENIIQEEENINIENNENNDNETQNENNDNQEDNQEDNKKEDFKLDTEHTNLKNLDKREERKEENLTDKQKNIIEEKKFKTLDNLIQFVPKKETHLKNVTKLSENRYGMYLSGEEIAQLYLDGNLGFDPSMQRGTKEDKQGNTHAFFKESHVNDIYNSIVADVYTPTQIVFGVIIDDGDELVYNENDNSLDIHGKMRLLDGNHRSKAFVKVKTWSFTGKLEKEIDLSNILTNVEVYFCTSNQARQIYANIDKNLKLNQAQVQQLSRSAESQIVNHLNQSENSEMRDKIATSRPVGKKLCLFNTITEMLKKHADIDTDGKMQHCKEYLTNFFNYLVNALPEAFGSNEDKRMKFREESLINENNMFKAWVRLALIDEEHYKENIDKVIANVDYYKKNNPIWLNGATVKIRTKKDAEGNKVPNGFSMNNTSTGFETLYDETFKIAGIDK